MSYSHFSIEDRNCIAYGIKNKKSYRSIAKILGRSHSSVMREIKRNTINEQYNPSYAQIKYNIRKKKCGAKLKLTSELYLLIYKCIKNRHSPEQISGRLKRNNSIHTICTKTIYTWIYKGLIPSISKKNLRRKGKKKVNNETRGKIGGKNISLRPAKVNTRRERGQWEGDTILGEKSKSALLTLVERKTRFTYFFKLENKRSYSVQEQVKKLYRKLPQKVFKSITFDNGKEFSRHKELEEESNLSIYFSNPGCPNERGTNENTNGLLREYFPKGRDLNKISNEELNDVFLEINSRPRKCLNYNTPLEVFTSYL